MDLKSRMRMFCYAFLWCWLVTGCTRQPVLDFAAHDRLAELPATQRAGIEATLLRMFGTPTNPLMRMPVLPDETEVDDESLDDEPLASASAEDGAAAGQENGAEHELAESQPALDAMLTGVTFEDQLDPKHLVHGGRVYVARCAGCHGVTGDGGGEAAPYLQPKPRDYRKGMFKFTSTPYGMKPARQDLVRVVRRGAKGTSMPAFPWMSDEDLNAVIDYVIMLSTRGEVESYVIGMSEDYEEDQPVDVFEFVEAMQMVNEFWSDAADNVVMPVTAEPPADEESVHMGFTLFRSQGCSKCHGEDGKGQTEWLSREFIEKQEALPAAERAEINYDVWGNAAPAADITARLLHGGRRPLDLYRRISTGINGTPMPAFGATFADDPDKIWHLVHYVLHIIEGGAADLGSEEASGEDEGTSTAETSSPELNDVAVRHAS